MTKAGGTGEENDEFLPYKVFYSYFERLFYMPLNIKALHRRLYLPSKGRRAAYFYCP
jgi:hypothetical protein